MMLMDIILRNRYKILKELGNGGFSVTYLAIDKDLPGNPKCVVKQLKTEHSNPTVLQIAKKLFDREAQVLYRLGKGHQQIPELLAHFEENGEFYLVQEFVDGHDLTKEIKLRQRLSEHIVVKLLEEILEVLVFVHENNVIHRDLKLRNIMRRRHDGKIVLIDFGAVKEIKGLAKNYQGDVNSTLIIGTPGYMPSEQANGKPRLCSDIYAVGMLGIHALTGTSPRELQFDPDSGEAIWRDSVNVSDRLATILTNMVRYNFSQRYRSAAEALSALRSPNISYGALPETQPVGVSLPMSPIPTTLSPNIPPPQLLSFFSRLNTVQVLGLLGIIGMGFGLGVFGWYFFQPNSTGNKPHERIKLEQRDRPTAIPSIPTTDNKVTPSRPTESPGSPTKVPTTTPLTPSQKKPNLSIPKPAITPEIEKKIPPFVPEPAITPDIEKKIPTIIPKPTITPDIDKQPQPTLKPSKVPPSESVNQPTPEVTGSPTPDTKKPTPEKLPPEAEQPIPEVTGTPIPETELIPEALLTPEENQPTPNFSGYPTLETESIPEAFLTPKSEQPTPEVTVSPTPETETTPEASSTPEFEPPTPEVTVSPTPETELIPEASLTPEENQPTPEVTVSPTPDSENQQIPTIPTETQPDSDVKHLLG